MPPCNLLKIKPLRQSPLRPVSAFDTRSARFRLSMYCPKIAIQVPTKSAIGAAMAYSIKHWEKLSLYTTDGKLQIDNNCVERSVRPVSIGRKNFFSAAAMKRRNELPCCILSWSLVNSMP